MKKASKKAPRIAVLPFKNIGPDSQDEFFADGMTGELILTLSKIDQLRVIARTSVQRYKGQSKSISEIAKELQVGTILDGSVRKDGNHIRIGVELIHAQSEELIWSEQYDREFEDIFRIQTDIANKVVDGLKIQFLDADKEKIERGATDNLDAYSDYLIGRSHLNQRTEEDLHTAIEHFERALEKDRTYAPAYSGVAETHAMLALFEFLPPREAFPKAKLAAERALQIDHSRAEAYAALGLVNFMYEWDWSSAETHFQAAIEQNPGYAPGHQYYADFLKAMGRFPEAIEEMETAQELDPASLAINTGVGHVLYLSREYDKAIKAYREAIELDPDFLQAHLWFGRPYLQKGMFQEAINEVSKAVDLSGGSALSLGVLGHVYASAGEREKAGEILQNLKELAQKQYVPSYWIALIYLGLEDEDRAFEWLEKATEERSSWLVWINVEPRMDALREDARFVALLERMRFAIDKHQLAFKESARVIPLLADMRQIQLSDFSVVGSYTRFEESTRNTLKDLKQKIVSGLESTSPKHENYLLWAPPGSGKTFFVQQVAEGVESTAEYREINLGDMDEQAFNQALSGIRDADAPVICLVDEVDSKASESWPYEVLLTHLDADIRPSGRTVFVLAGSSGSDFTDFKKNISSRPKGTDLLSRVPNENQYIVPPLTLGDRVLIAITLLLVAGKRMKKPVSDVEKLALFYIAQDPNLSSARQLREFVFRCVERVPPADDRLKYDNLFEPGDPKNKEFWVAASKAAPQLGNSYIRIS